MPRAQGLPRPHSGVRAIAEHARKAPLARRGVPPILPRPEPAPPRRDRHRSAPSAVTKPTWPRGLRLCIVYVKLRENYQYVNSVHMPRAPPLAALRMRLSAAPAPEGRQSLRETARPCALRGLRACHRRWHGWAVEQLNNIINAVSALMLSLQGPQTAASAIDEQGHIP
ncbi:hypothetical protein HYPSUDRAFT_214808 [Hypholoma sublateritium FD-334 SS-4]|uniref:Uncharacterized protein n=1 Tax=Hypholoma sublateritium (strain FD-334 SS-4) TaxID=945553 RepID=A0A0D2MK48_HYPSF|nr:hypothetical protein HYPSUDRAFT_214808 [Hypholoma sublateritium FD-334 SS-4]